jgi:ABC-2 type transport system ATP-binding protein
MSEQQGDVPAAEPLIQARGVRRTFGDLVAVDGVDLDIHRGEVFGFLGPNGAGKSTLLRMLIGLLAPTDGEVRVMGYQLPREADRLRPNVGYMTQRFSLYDDLSVEENLDFAAEIFGMGRKVRRERVEKALRRFRLDARRAQRPGTLSGGWRQRLALATATIHCPALLLLDEPTAGVDPENRRDFWARLFELAEEGTTILVSTHYMDEAVRCHRLLMLRQGRREALGRPAELEAELDGRVIEILAEPVSEAVDALDGLPHVASVTQLGNRIHLLLTATAPRAQVLAPAIAEHLRGNVGLSRAEAFEAEPNLEDVFVAVGLGERLGEQQEPRGESP